MIVTSKELRALGISTNKIKKLTPVDYAGPESSARFRVEDAQVVLSIDLTTQLAALRGGELAPVVRPKAPKAKRPWGWDAWPEWRQIEWAKDHT